MALRQEDLLIQEAVVYRFPTRALQARTARARMMARRRRSLAIGAVAVAAGLLIAGGPVPPTSDPGTAPSVGVVTVAPGDTLWGIATRHGPSSGDPRSYVAELAARNGVNGPLRPGMRLELP